MSREFEMSEADHCILLEACKPVPLIAINCGRGPSQQEHANDAWRALGDRMGFDWLTVKPSPKGPRFFIAMEKET